MENQTAVELLKIAAQLAQARIGQNNIRNKSINTNTVEAIFSDCLAEVEKHHARLIAKSE